MKLKIKKTDARYAGNKVFDYVVDVKSDSRGLPSLYRLEHFHEVREWCWTTWGPSIEREHYLEMLRLKYQGKMNEHWSWHSEHGDTKIYLRTEKELTWFRLKWAEWLS